jgi:hypothetical protein
VSTTGTSGFDLPGLAHLEWDGRGRNVVTYIYLLRRGANCAVGAPPRQCGIRLSESDTLLPSP